MQIKARVVDVYRDRITIETETPELFEGNIDKELIFDIKGQGRSLNANSYFHLLSDKIAEKLHVSKPFSKNTLIGRYGQRETDENGKWIKISVVDDIDMQERGDIHCFPIGHSTLEGKNFTHYGIMKPTHCYTVKEMQVLIDGTVTDAESLGIPTMTEEQIQEMLGKWREHKR